MVLVHNYSNQQLRARASSSSWGGSPMSFLTRNTCFSLCYCVPRMLFILRHYTKDLLQLPNSLSSTLLTLEVLSIKHWHQSAFAETPSTARHSREARRSYINPLYIYIYRRMHAWGTCAAKFWYLEMSS